MESRQSLTGLAAALLASLAIGCVSIGSEFPVQRVTELRVGETTRDQVQRVFGEPWRTGLEDGQRTWTYGEYHLSAFGGAHARDLVVRFDDRGVVSSYSFNSTYPEDGEL